ncbi:MAG: NAD-dependent epimerase/dehydratase family protein [Solirubrobacteraceae bacterium]
MRVGITGAAGFIGRPTVGALQDRGHEVVALDCVEGDGILKIDVLDRPAVEQALAECEAVIHLAGVLGTHELFADPHHAVDVNIKGALNVLETCRIHDLRFVGITMLQVWENVYQATKNCADRLASAWHRHHGVPVSHVRAFNGYGPGQAHGPGHPLKIVPTFSAAAWNGQPIPIWGDGTQLVDLVHVDDIARMLVDAMDFGDDELLDAGTGEAISVKEVAEIVNDVVGSDAGIVHFPMRLGEHRSDDVVATGVGWELLDWRPRLDRERLAETVHAYSDAAWYDLDIASARSTDDVNA